MFSKDEEKMRSFVGTQSEFHGELTVMGTLRMDGVVTGRVQADQVILGEVATIKGDVLARKIIVGGKVEGNIRAPELVEIRSKGKVRGDIFTNNLSVMEGGEFNGKIEMGTDESKVLDFESRGQELSLNRQ
ncbi:MAG: polymer-forming cytoskeletal protein [Acidobacteriia bacterium]|nr:polymer-forming cytoskeletal protein [Terriglobia bacterium]